ncbi:MAG TPA: MlaD family protein [Actinomycetota bacterium]|nr:MlaD family protein [Actinomycetota bacterium]
MTETSDLPRHVRRRSAVLGGVACALFVGAIWATWVFLQGGFQGGMPINVVFSAPGAGQQLPEGGDVKVRGVLVGRIGEVSLDDDGDAVVHVRIDEGYSFPETTRAEIRSKTVFGQKWLELFPPAVATGPMLRAGDTIPDAQTKEPLELESALQLGHDLLSDVPLGDLSTVLHTLARGFSGNERNGRASIDKGLRAVRAVNSRSDELDLALRQLGNFSEWLDANDDDLVSFMQALDSANRALVGAAPEFRSSLATVTRFLNDAAAFQEATEGDLGSLVENGASVAEIVAARSDRLQDIVVELRPFTTVWNSGLSQPCRGLYESGLTCWQVFQMPGIESRGLYHGTTPANDEPGDPGNPPTGANPRLDASGLRSLLSRYGRGPVSPDLARVLSRSARETGLLGGDR